MLLGIASMMLIMIMILFITVYASCIAGKHADEAAGYEEREEKQWRKRT